MRAVKDLNAYLTKHRAEDEYATNLFGGALNVAAQDPALKRADLWQTAFREWDRRNYLLDHSRPGWRRWGTRWVSDDEYKVIKAKQEELRQSVVDAQERVNRSSERAASLVEQYQNATKVRDAFASLASFLRSGSYNSQATWNLLAAGQTTPMQTAAAHFAEADASMRQLGPDAELACKEYERDFRALLVLMNKVIRPEWPTRFEPVDPDSLETSKPPQSSLAA